jgi:hypothetical protein
MTTSPPHAVTFSDLESEKIYVAVTSEDGNLWIRYWNGSKWIWDPHGRPKYPPNPTIKITSPPFAVGSQQWIRDLRGAYRSAIYIRSGPSWICAREALDHSKLGLGIPR